MDTDTPTDAATAAWEAMVSELAPVILDHLPRSMREDRPFARHLAVAVAMHLEKRGLIPLPETAKDGYRYLVRDILRDAPWGVGERVEWAVGDPDDCASDDLVAKIDGPAGLTDTDRGYGRSLLQRTVRLGPWTPADPS